MQLKLGLALWLMSKYSVGINSQLLVVVGQILEFGGWESWDLLLSSPETDLSLLPLALYHEESQDQAKEHVRILWFNIRNGANITVAQCVLDVTFYVQVHSLVKEGIKLGLKDIEENHRILSDVFHLPSLYESCVLLPQRVSQVMPKVLETYTSNLALSQRPQNILP